MIAEGGNDGGVSKEGNDSRGGKQWRSVRSLSLLMQDFKCMMVDEFVDIVVTKLVK